jgi:hypothetical protein
MRASSEVVPVKGSADAVHLAQADVSASRVSMALSSPETAPLPQSKPHETHIQIEEPLVFSASDLPPSQPAAMPQKRSLAASNTRGSAALPATVVPSPSSRTGKPRDGFFGKVKGFFTAIFH